MAASRASRAPVCSVIIPARNAVDTIGEQLEAVLAQQCPGQFEVVVADNGSIDETAGVVAAIASRDPRVRLVDASDAAGEPGARNAAVAACRAPVVASCDADDVVRPGWLAAIEAAFDAGAQAAHVTREYWTLNPGFRAAGFPETQVNDWLAGGAFAVSRDLFLGLGGFDASMPLCADTEFGFRLYERTGRQPIRLAEAIVSVRLPADAVHMFQRVRRQARTWPELRRRHPQLMTPGADQLWSTRRQFAWWLTKHTDWVFDDRRLAWMEVAATALGEFEGCWSASVNLWPPVGAVARWGRGRLWLRGESASVPRPG